MPRTGKCKRTLGTVHKIGRYILPIGIKDAGDAGEHLLAAGSIGNFGSRTRDRQTACNLRAYRNNTSLAHPSLHDVVIASHVATVVADRFTKQAGTHEDRFNVGNRGSDGMFHARMLSVPSGQRRKIKFSLCVAAPSHIDTAPPTPRR